MPTQEQAKKAWLHMQKGKQYYGAMTDEQKKAAWQYGYDRKLIQTDKLGPGASAEYQKYVNPSRPEYKPQASIVRRNVPQPIQTQQEKIMSVVTPSIVKNMVSQSPEQMAADRRRILNEQRLESITPQPMQPRLPQTGSIRQRPTLKHERAKTYEAKESFDPIKATGKLALDTLSTVNSVLQTPATMGKYGVESMEQAKAEGKSPVLGLLKGYGTGLKKAITNQDAVENTEVIEGVAPKTTEALKQKFPGAYNAVSTIVNLIGIDDLTAWGLLGDLAKVQKLGKLPDTTKALIKANADNLANIAVKKKAGQVLSADENKIVEAIRTDIDDYYDTIGYYDEAYRGTPEYIKSEARLNVPKAKEIKTLTKTIGEPEKTIIIDKPFENAVNKVSTKKIKLTPEEAQLNDILKRSNTNIDEFISEAENIVKDLEERQFQYLKNNKAKGVQQANVIRNDMGEVTGRFGKISNNDRWYREFYAENRRPPSNAEMREMAKKHLLEGFETDTVAIPANKEYIQALKDLESYKNIKASNIPIMPKTSTTVQKGTIPTPELIPSTLQTKGQTLKPNKPILSALDAKVNKPYVEPIRPILDLPKTPVEAPKVSGGINTLPIENKSLTGAIKASDETLEGTLPKTAKTDTLQTRLYDDIPKGDIAEGMKERGFSKNIRTDTAMPDDIRIDFDDSPLAYKQVGNPETLSKAENIMKNGQSQAMSQYYELLSKNKPESVPLAKLIAKNAEAAGDIDTARRVLADAAEKLTEAGQFSQAAKILRESDPETFLMMVDKQLRKLNEQGLKQYGKKWADIDLLPDEITAIQNIPRGNQQAYEEVWEQIANRISKDLPSTKMEKFDAWRRMAMLLNPKTHIRNTVGNVFMVGMRKTSDTLGAGLEKLFRIKERTKSFGWSRNKELVSKVDDIWNTVKKDILGESRWEIDNIKSLGREKNIFKNKTLQGLNEFSLKTLNAEDNIFTQRAFKDALGQFMQANGLKEANEKAIEYATRRAWESTYKQANKLADWINQAKKTPVVGRLVEAAIPFTKTPANIMKTTFEYSPAGLVKLIFSKGKPPAEVIETLAKGLTGTSITGLGFMLASMGAAKTQNSKSNKVSAIDTEMGEQPYSIITPQGSYTFDWAQPLAVPLAMGIAMYESINNKDELDFEAVMDSIAQGGDSLFNMSMLQNIKQFLGYGSTTENILGLPWNYVQQAWPSLFGQVAKTIDTTRRSTYDPNPQKQTWNLLKSRIPFASKSLEPSLNVWGEEQKQGGIIQQFINPGYAREKSNGPVTIEISRLYAEHGDNDMLPKMAQNFKIEGKTTKLSPGDMTEFQRKMGQENHTEINRLISSAQYQLLGDKDKMKKIKKIVNDNYEEAKEGIIKKMK